MNGNKSTHEPAYQKIIDLQDHDASAFVVIDSYLGGGGTGGIRMGESVTLEEVASLAHEMSLKFAWLNIARGGAKSGIAYTGELSAERKNRLLVEFGKGIADLVESGAYIPGMDLGIGPQEIAVILSREGLQTIVQTDSGDIDSNYFTALTVFTRAIGSFVYWAFRTTPDVFAHAAVNFIFLRMTF